MNEAGLYAENNGPQVKDVVHVLEKYFHLIRWKMDRAENVLDVGCGDGFVTAEVLRPLLPDNVVKLVGVDISLEMVNFAKSHHDKESFLQMDVSTKQLDAELSEKFDHIFSFYCLHWVQDQRQCASNLYDMLKPGGDIFLVFIARDLLCETYRNLSRHNNWGEYMKNVEDYICPYYDSKDPADEYEKLLCQVGFEVNLCGLIDRSYTFPDESSWKNWAMAINPFLGKIPSELKPDYINDVLNAMKSDQKRGYESIEMTYQSFVVHATKPA